MLNLIKNLRAKFQSRTENQKGNIILYLTVAIGCIILFYALYFLFWTEVKGWFIKGS